MSHKRSITLFCAVLALLVTLPTAGRTWVSKNALTGAESKAPMEQDFPEQDEIHQIYPLLPGARVEVSIIYGPVDIETVDTTVAEVHIIRSARTREDLSSRKIDIEHTSTSLVIQGERDRSEGPAKVRHRMLLKVPRRVDLSVQMVNARVNVGEVDGTVRLSRINGAVKVAQTLAHAEVSQINGSLTITIKRTQ